MKELPVILFVLALCPSVQAQNDASVVPQPQNLRITIGSPSGRTQEYVAPLWNGATLHDALIYLKGAVNGFAFETEDIGQHGLFLKSVGDLRNNDGTAEYLLLFVAPDKEITIAGRGKKQRLLLRPIRDQRLIIRPFFLDGPNDGLSKTLLERQSPYASTKVQAKVEQNKNLRAVYQRLIRRRIPSQGGIFLLPANRYPPPD